MKSQTKKKVLSSLLWKMLERNGTQGIQLLVQIVLARILLPEVFGTLAVLTVFISFARVFVEYGFNTALIQKKNADDLDFSSVFYLNGFIVILLYSLIYIFAPWISEFFKNESLVWPLRGLALILPFGAINAIQNVYVARNMMFKNLFFSSLGAIIISGTVGIVSAYFGAGVWALVAQQLVNQISISLILWFTVKWRPKLIFSWERVKGLFSYGWKLLVSQLLNILYMDIRTLIIGKRYDSSTLGYYSKGEQFPKVIVTSLDGSIQAVMLPALSAHQDNRKKVKDMVRRAIMTSSFLIFPMMIGLAVVAEPLVRVVLTEKWMKSVPFLQMFCIAHALRPIHTANLQAINAVGRSDIFLKLEVIKKIIGLTIVLISIPFGVYALAFGMVISGLISSFVNAYPNKKLLNYSYKEQWGDIMPSLLISLLMGGIVYCFNFLKIDDLILLPLQIITGVIIYFSSAKLFKLECFNYLLETMKELISGKIKK